MRYKLTITEQIIESHNLPITNLKTGWEVGRLVLDSRYRGQKSLAQCLYLSSKWLKENTDINTLFASCSHKMSRVYHQFGLKTLEKDLLLPGTTKHYNIISGDLSQVFKKLNILHQKLV
jgi:predicted GNAT family N-acyltransferase